MPEFPHLVAGGATPATLRVAGRSRKDVPLADALLSSDGLGRLFALPFVDAASDGLARFWAPRPRGEYGTDCAIGSAYGRALVSYAREFRDEQIFRDWSRGLLKSGDCERDAGLLVGMLGEIGREIIGGQR